MATELYKTAVRAVILDHQNRVMLGLRSKETSPGYNQWALFGGKPKEKETLKKATVREVKEEIGLNIRVKRLFTTTLDKSTTPHDAWMVYFYVVEIIGGNLLIKLDEHSRAEYFSREQLEGIDIAFNHRNVLADFFTS